MIIRVRSRKRKNRIELGAKRNKRFKKTIYFDETSAVKPEIESYFNPKNQIFTYNEILSLKRGVESEFGLFNEFIKEFKELYTIFKKRFDIYKAIVYRLSNKIINLEESFDKAKDDIKEIDKKVSGMIIYRDHVIITLAKMINSELSPGHFF
jgi:hypothetical protein